MTLQLYNTRTRQREPFVPHDPRVVRIYTCGLTVYARMHIGHARTYCFWDTFRRYLEYRGHHVLSVINYTDIDDRIMAGAGDGVGCQDLAERTIASFRGDCRALHIKDYAAYTRATDFIAEQVRAVADLIERGHAYVVDGEVFYAVESFADYGALSGNRLDQLQSGASGRLNRDAGRKRHPMDFTLWKPSAADQPQWATGHPQWPSGRPGWHIECSVMSRHMLGDHFDVHGGAVDNLFPHHENEIAQSEPVCGAPWVRYWMHPEHLDLQGTKMSKSLGNVIDVPSVLERHDYAALRWYFASSHYRSKLAFTHELLDECASGFARVQRAVDAMVRTLERIGVPHPTWAEPSGYASVLPEGQNFPRERNSFGQGQFADLSSAFMERFIAAMDEDMGTGRATAEVFEYVRKLNAAGLDDCDDARSVASAYRCLTRHLHVLGIELASSKWYPELAADAAAPDTKASSADEGLSGVIDQLVAERGEARKQRDFERADMLRDVLSKVGIEIEDRPDGARWSLRSR